MTTKSMARRTASGTAWLLTLALGVGACDFLDPTKVDNPTTTDEDLAEAERPTEALLPGLRAQFARAVGATVSTTENASDNYSIHGTGILKQLDDPYQTDPTIVDATGTGSASAIYWHNQELRALGDFVIDVIAADDPTATADQIAEARYYRGMGLLHLAENFSAFPLEKDGTPLPASEALSRAITDLSAATNGPLGTAAKAALARAYRWQGDATQAINQAVEVLAADPAFLFQQEYDSQSIENNPFAYLFLRALQEMQPLPRLDFLDPKYTSREAGIAVAKAEEMHLIMAEARFAQGDFAQGKTHLGNAIRLAHQRGATDFVDNDQRLNADLSIRPRNEEIRVAAEPGAPFRAGLVLDRPDESIPVPTVSGTSLDADSIEAIPVSETENLWHALWLARQEILFLEGRRMADLGLRLPMMLREIDANPNISDGDAGTRMTIPAYMTQAVAEVMDTFTPSSPYDASENLTTTEVTMDIDLNRLLAQRNSSPFSN
ncbi:MAG: hypothetical protein KC645_03285 [Gemmatimonadetes bacterium]|nr:hypothetical protein [Gemmatimonadota bacterium]